MIFHVTIATYATYWVIVFLASTRLQHPATSCNKSKVEKQIILFCNFFLICCRCVILYVVEFQYFYINIPMLRSLHLKKCLVWEKILLTFFVCILYFYTLFYPVEIFFLTCFDTFLTAWFVLFLFHLFLVILRSFQNLYLSWYTLCS